MISLRPADTLDDKLPYKDHKSITGMLRKVLWLDEEIVMTLGGSNGKDRHLLSENRPSLQK